MRASEFGVVGRPRLAKHDLTMVLQKKLNTLYGRFSIWRRGVYFVDIPRTSSSSIRSELGKKFGRAYGKQNVIEKEHTTPQIFPDHMPAREMRAILGPSVWDRLFTFTIVRNPWDRVLSMYHYRRKRGNIPESWSFRDYVLALASAGPETPYFKYRGFRYGAADYVLGDNGELLVDTVVRYENRAEGLATVARRLKLDVLGQASLQSAPRASKDYAEFYDAETEAAIRKRYAKDIELFGYGFSRGVTDPAID